MSRMTRRVTGASLSTALLVLLAATPAWAAPEGRIQQVETQPGSVQFILSAEGLASGESIDAASVTTTIAGQAASTSATDIADTESAPQRTVMLVLDSSGSMAEFGKLETAQEAANLYLEGLPPDVRAGLISFADDAAVRVEPTADRAAVSKAINALTAEGSTALNDAVVLAVDELGDDGSRNIVVLSDGEDEGSSATAREARKAVADSGVVLDAVALGTGEQEAALAAFTKAGNGTLVTATDADALTAAFEQAARTVTTQLAVTAQVPAGVDAGTVELVVKAVAGGQPISDSTAALVEPAPQPSASESAFGPIAAPPAERGFFDQPWFLIAVMALVFVALLTITSLAVGAIDAKNRKQGRVARRLEEVSLMGSAPDAPTKQPETVLGESATIRKAVSFAEKVASSRDTTAINRKLESANVSLRPSEWVIVHGLIAILACLLTTLLTNFNLLLAAVALGLGILLPWLYLSRRADTRRKKFYEALPDSMQMLAGSLSAGYSLPQAFDNVARESGGPIAQEVNRALLESRLGLPLEETLEAVAQRMDSKDFHWVVMAIRINKQVGGNLAEVLTTVSKTLRERERLRRQVKALSAEGVMSAWILGLLPIGIAVLVAATRPAYLYPMLTNPIGWVMILMGVVLYVIGVVWMRNLVKMEV